MKALFSASSIVALALFLSGCDSLGLTEVFAPDQIPPLVKAEERLVGTPVSDTTIKAWPRLGDVPVRPNDFSTKPVYTHYMDELSQDRVEAEHIRQNIITKEQQ